MFKMIRSCCGILVLLQFSFLNLAYGGDTCGPDRNGDPMLHNDEMFDECVRRVHISNVYMHPSVFNPKKVCVDFDELVIEEQYRCFENKDLGTFFAIGIGVFIFILILDLIGILFILWNVLKCLFPCLEKTGPPVNPHPPAANPSSMGVIMPQPLSVAGIAA